MVVLHIPTDHNKNINLNVKLRTRVHLYIVFKVMTRFKIMLVVWFVFHWYFLINLLDSLTFSFKFVQFCRTHVRHCQTCVRHQDQGNVRHTRVRHHLPICPTYSCPTSNSSNISVGHEYVGHKSSNIDVGHEYVGHIWQKWCRTRVCRTYRWSWCRTQVWQCRTCVRQNQTKLTTKSLIINKYRSLNGSQSLKIEEVKGPI